MSPAPLEKLRSGLEPQLPLESPCCSGAGTAVGGTGVSAGAVGAVGGTGVSAGCAALMAVRFRMPSPPRFTGGGFGSRQAANGERNGRAGSGY